jgi:hypothetical protein
MISKKQYSFRIAIILLFGLFHTACLPFFTKDNYFQGEIEFEINGETVKHKRVWRCEEKSVFRPVGDTLFKDVYLQTPRPKESFVVKKFGTDQAILFDNWMNCGTELRRAGIWTPVSIFDSIKTPRYSERLYLKVGDPITIQNPYENTFKTRLIKEIVTSIDERTYKNNVNNNTDDDADLLFQLRLKAAYGLTVDVLTWNDTDKIALREGIPLNKNIWEVERLKAPLSKIRSAYNTEPTVHNSSIILMPNDYKGKYSTLFPPKDTIEVKYAGRTIVLDEKGFAEILRPEPNIKLVRFFARVDSNIWAGMCRANPLPQCPLIPSDSK